MGARVEKRTVMTSLTARVAVSAQRYSKPTTADADYKLQQDLARPIIYHLRVATCSQPEVKGLTMMTNSQYNGWRFEDVWLDK